jgi:hypothetical protein
MKCGTGFTLVGACAVGSRGGRRPGLGDYVTGPGATRGTTGAGGC